MGTPILRAIPSIDRLLKRPEIEVLIAEYGRRFVTATLRSVIAETRSRMAEQSWNLASEDVPGYIVDRSARRMQQEMTASLMPVFNLTGTVLHTNLGRAPLPRRP